MYGRRDLVDSYLFLRGRLTSAALRIDPDAPERPLRRMSTGMNIGIAVAVAATIIVAVLNIFLFTVNDAWRNTPGALIFEQSTGTRYLLVDDRLHPVLNLASAALLVGAPPQVVTVSADDIAAVPRGPSLGEVGLPDTLPSPSAAPSVWTVCPADGGTALRIAPESNAVEVDQHEAVLVVADDELYLIWDGRRFHMADDWAARALGFEPGAAVHVELRWLNTIPSGADLDLSHVTLGGDGPTLAGEPTTLGQLVQIGDAERGSGSYVVTADGLMPVTETVAALLSAVPNEDVPEPLQTTRRVLTSANVIDSAPWQERLPEVIPTPMGAQFVPCAVWHDGEVALAALDADDMQATVEVAPGSGVLASTAPAPGVSGTGLYLVSDTGLKYPVADTETASALGLAAEAALAVPEELLSLLPTGPLIDR